MNDASPQSAVFDALFVGGETGMEQALVTREGINFVGIQAGGLHGLGVVQKMRNTLRLFSGFFSAMRMMNQYKPDAVLLTGGFVGVPVSLAAWLQRVPSVVFLPDVEPGLALKVMARFANKIVSTTEASAAYVSKSKHVITGYPVREVFHQVSRQSGRAQLGIAAPNAFGADEKVLLIFGGSKGARSINRAALAGMAQLLELAVVIHVTGSSDWEEVCQARGKMSTAQQARYLAFPYLHEEMASAMAAADLVICRSGASALGELPILGLPAVLVPYPHAWRYQKVNAEYLVGHNAAMMLADAQLSDPQHGLVSVVAQLLSNPQQLQTMRHAMQLLGRADGADKIADVLCLVAQKANSKKNAMGGVAA